MIISTKFYKKYSDEEIVLGVYKRVPNMQRVLFLSCEKYFYSHYKGVFFVQKSDADDIFQNSIIALMQNIERKKIYVEDGIIRGKNQKVLEGTIYTYMMGIAKLKYLEWCRQTYKESNYLDIQSQKIKIGEDIHAITNEWLSEDSSVAKSEIIADCLSKMPERCYQILTKFYDEGKNLDAILVELTTFNSKDALKTAKNKCMNKLKESANIILQFRRKQGL